MPTPKYTDDRLGPCCQCAVNNFIHIINTFLNYREENECVKI